MYHQIITKIEQDMLPYLNNEQMDALRGALEYHLHDWQEDAEAETQETDLITVFLAAKRVEGCSQKTVQYYDSTIRNVLNAIGKDIKQITTDDLRCYLDEYQQEHKISKVTIDNIRRILSTFFAWLEDESYIIKSPVRRIHKVKTCKTVKETYSDEALEIMRDNVDHIRDLAIIDMLASTGMRVGELITLDRDDIDFVNRECVVLGKGNKQRKVYFDARTKIHL
jgi:site-specific recombinase XerD